MIHARGGMIRPRKQCLQFWLHIESPEITVKDKHSPPPPSPLLPLNQIFGEETKKLYIKTDSNAVAL